MNRQEIAEAYAKTELQDNHAPIAVIVAAAFLDGIDYEQHHPRWIAVEDELPPLHEHMLIAPTQEHIERVGGRAVDVICFMDEEHLAAWLPHITHWMPLPAPPTKKGGEQ